MSHSEIARAAIQNFGDGARERLEADICRTAFGLATLKKSPVALISLPKIFILNSCDENSNLCSILESLSEKHPFSTISRGLKGNDDSGISVVLDTKVEIKDFKGILVANHESQFKG